MKCINDKFSPEQLEIFERFKIKTPVQGESSSVRRRIQTRFGDAYHLNEIVNPLIPTESGVSAEDEMKYEPGFHVSRFIDEELTIEISEEDTLESVEQEKLLAA